MIFGFIRHIVIPYNNLVVAIHPTWIKDEIFVAYVLDLGDPKICGSFAHLVICSSKLFVASHDANTLLSFKQRISPLQVIGAI